MPHEELKYEEFVPSLMRLCWDEHRHREAIKSNLALVPFSSSFFGAVLFADISGFTRLSYTLSAEELKRYINSYFSTVLGVIESYSGDVIKFCGDALLVAWPVSVDAPLKVKEAAVMMASKCALNLVNKSLAPPNKSKSASKIDNQFRFHCGVSCGIIHGYVVGTSSRLEFLISGDAIEKAGNAAAEASSGQVCLSPDAIELVRFRFGSQSMAKGNHLIIELRYCQADCFRCAHLSGLYRLHRPTTAATSSGDNLDSSPIDVTPRSGLTEDELDSDSSSNLRPKYRKSKSLFNRLTVSFREKFSESPKVIPAGEFLSLGADLSESAEANIKSYHLDVQRTEAVVADFLRPYAISALFSAPVASTPALSGIGEEAAENFYGLFVGKMVRVALESDMVDFIAEMKTVTTVFIDIIGCEEDFREGRCEQPQNAIACVLEALHQCGGFLRQYIVDDKGCVAICGFGVPGYCHNDDSVRAVESAVRISRGLRQYHLSSRIGIAVGDVYCGLVGSKHRCEYAMMGVSVNLAARLMGKCERGKILVTNDVRNACMDHFQFEGRPEIKAKGFKLPIPVFTPISRYMMNPSKEKYSVKHRNEIFVGRQKELRSITSAVYRYCDSVSGDLPHPFEAYLIEGRSGMGMRSILAEVYHVANTEKINILSAVCNSPGFVDAIGEYETISQILSQIFFCNSELSLDNLKPNKESNLASECKMGGARKLSWEPFNHSQLLYRNCRARTDSEDKQVIQADELKEEERAVLRWFATFCKPSDCLTTQNGIGTASPIQSIQRLVDVNDDTIENIDLSIDNSFSRESNGRKEKVVPQNQQSSGDTSVAFYDSEDFVQDYNTYIDNLKIPLDECLCLLNNILPVRFPPHERLVTLPSSVRDRLREALVVLVLRRFLAVKPFMIMINAFHWCDISSLNALHLFLSSKPSNIFFVCGLETCDSMKSGSNGVNALDSNSFTSFTVPSSEVINIDVMARIRKFCAVLKLLPFGPDDTIELMKKILGDEFLSSNPIFISPETIDQIVKRSSGSPSLLVSLIYMMKDTGVDDKTVEQNMRSLRDTTSISFDSLSPAEKFVLKICSVVGLSFCEEDVTLLSHRMQISRHSFNILTCLNDLVAKHFLVILPSSEGDSTNQYQFVTSYMQESVYNLMLQHQKSKAHGVYAGILENRFHASHEHLPLLVYHYMKSNDNSKKFEMLMIGLKEVQGTNDNVRIFNYLTYLINIWTKGSVADIISRCCSPTPSNSSVGVVNKTPHLKCTKSNRKMRTKFPVHLGSNSYWLTQSDFVSEFEDLREEKKYLPCWLVERSSILFCEGMLHDAHNEALLALHICGLGKVLDASVPNGSYHFNGHSDLSVHHLVSLNSAFIQVAAINLMFGRQSEFTHFMHLSNRVDETLETSESDQVRKAYESSFYFYCIHDLKSMMCHLLLKSDRDRVLIRKKINIHRPASDGDSSNSADSLESFPLSSTSTVLSIVSSASMTIAQAAFSPAVPIQVSVGGYDTPESAHIINVKKLMSSTKRVSDDSTLSDALVALSEGEFTAANFSLSLLRNFFSRQPFLRILEKYFHLLSAWSAILSAQPKRSRALVNYLLEFALAFKQSILYKWTSQLNMLLTFLASDWENETIFSTIEAYAIDIKQRTREDGLAAGTSSILALSLTVSLMHRIQTGGLTRAVAFARYAINKLATRSSLTIMAGVFLFISGYSAALLMQCDNFLLNSLPRSAAKTHRDHTPRIFSNCLSLVEKALDGISNMATPNGHPCLILLHDALAIKFYCAKRMLSDKPLANASNLPPNVPFLSAMSLNSDSKISYMFKEFTFGLAFLQLEQLHLIKSCSLLSSNESLINVKVLEHELMKNFAALGCPASTYTQLSGPDSVLSYLLTEKAMPPPMHNSTAKFCFNGEPLCTLISVDDDSTKVFRV